MKLDTKKLMTMVVLIFTAGLVAAGCTTVSAEPTAESVATGEATQPDQATQGNKAAIGVRTERHLMVALLTARQMFDGVGGYQADQVTIVTCGPAVQSLAQKKGFEAEIERTKHQGDLRVVACGLTVQRMEIDPDTLISSVEVVPNGFIELARLQALGYESVEL